MNEDQRGFEKLIETHMNKKVLKKPTANEWTKHTGFPHTSNKLENIVVKKQCFFLSLNKIYTVPTWENYKTTERQKNWKMLR